MALSIRMPHPRNPAQSCSIPNSSKTPYEITWAGAYGAILTRTLEPGRTLEIRGREIHEMSIRRLGNE